MTLACFKAYDVRGRVLEELDEGLATRIGRAFVEVTGAREVVVGRDIRLSSPSLATALAAGLNEGGADVLDIDVCGTEEVYFATEAPNGELGFYLVGDGTNRAYRARCRPPSFINFSLFPHLIRGHTLSDVVAVLGSLNIIAAELDR